MPHEIVEHETRVVATLTDDAVRTEQPRQVVAAGQLQSDDCGSAGDDDPVRGEEGPQRRASAFEDGEEDRCGQCRGHEHQRLHPNRVGKRDQHEQQHLSDGGRAFQHTGELPGDQEEQRIERVLGHDRAGVRHRRNRDRQHSRPERPPVADEAACEEECGHGCQRHQQRVDRLHGGVRIGQPVEEGVGGRDQERVADPVPGRVHIAHEPLARIGKAAGELGIDQLVDEDERRDHPPGKPRAEGKRDDDDRGEPAPGRNAAQPIDQARPRRGAAPARSPRASPPRCRRPRPRATRRRARRP